MIARAVAVWGVILAAAMLNGAARQAWLIPRFGDKIGRAVSTAILCAVVVLVTWISIGWMHPLNAGDALKVGVLWLALTLGFEFLAGHYLFGKSWAVLREDYDLTRGRIWILVLVVVLLAPLWAGWMRGMFVLSP